MAESLRTGFLSIVFKHIGESLLDRVARLPACCCAELACISNEQPLIDWADAGWIDPDLDRASSKGPKVFERIGELGAASSAEVVNLTSLPLLGEQPVGAGNVANVCEVANDIKIPNCDVVSPPSLDLRYLKCQCREYIRRQLPRSGVVEGANDDNISPVGQVMFDAKQVRRSLACPVWIRWAQRTVLSDGQVDRRGVAIANPRAYQNDSWPYVRRYYFDRF
jgi:hypothetical protein